MPKVALTAALAEPVTLEKMKTTGHTSGMSGIQGMMPASRMRRMERLRPGMASMPASATEATGGEVAEELAAAGSALEVGGAAHRLGGRREAGLHLLREGEPAEGAGLLLLLGVAGIASARGTDGRSVGKFGAAG